MSTSTFLIAKVVGVGVVLLALFALFLIFRRSSRVLRKTVWQWLGAVISLGAICASLFGFYLLARIECPLELVGQKVPPMNFRILSDDSQRDFEQFTGKVGPTGLLGYLVRPLP